jgi:hypothetical protein
LRRRFNKLPMCIIYYTRQIWECSSKTCHLSLPFTTEFKCYIKSSLGQNYSSSFVKILSAEILLKKESYLKNVVFWQRVANIFMVEEITRERKSVRRYHRQFFLTKLTVAPLVMKQMGGGGHC